MANDKNKKKLRYHANRFKVYKQLLGYNLWNPDEELKRGVKQSTPGLKGRPFNAEIQRIFPTHEYVSNKQQRGFRKFQATLSPDHTLTDHLYKKTHRVLARRRYLKHFHGGLGKSQLRDIGGLKYRLDMVVYKAGFSQTIFSAKAHIKSGFIKINNSVTTSPSAIVQRGDLVTVRPSRVRKVHEHYIQTKPQLFNRTLKSLYLKFIQRYSLIHTNSKLPNKWNGEIRECYAKELPKLLRPSNIQKDYILNTFDKRFDVCPGNLLVDPRILSVVVL